MQINVKTNTQQIVFDERELDGKRYLVAPMTLAKVGVMNGSLMTHEEMSKNLAAWGDIAIPLSHPTDDKGNFLSAKDPAVLAKHSVGRFMNPRIENNMLKGEAWIDVAKAETIPDGQRLLKANSEGLTVEVSSGFFADIDAEHGFHNNDEYWGVWRNIVPDHAAILLDEIGACSLEDGCGLNVNEVNFMDSVKAKFNAFLDEFISDKRLQANGDCSCNESSEEAEEQMSKETAVEIEAGEGAEMVEVEKVEAEKIEEVVEEQPNDEVEALKAQLGAVNGFFERFGGMEKAAEIMTNAQAVLDAQKNAEQTEREKLSGMLAVNGLSENDIASTPLTVLRQLARQNQRVDYSGQGTPIQTNEKVAQPKAVLLAEKE